MPKVINKRKINEPVIGSYWPIGIRRLFLSLNEIPWISLTAVATLVGSVLLFIYFTSIGFMPLDPSSLIGLGVITAMVALIVIFVLAFSLLSPTWIYQNSLSESSALNFVDNRLRISYYLVGLQLMPMGLLLGVTAYSLNRDCQEMPTWLLVVTLAMFVVWGTSIFQLTAMESGWRSRMWIFFVSLLVGFCGSFPVVFLRPIQQSLFPSGDAAFFALMALWAITICINALVAPRMRGWKVVVSGVFFTTWLFAVVPMIGTNPSVFPKIVASLVGVRQEANQDLYMPRKTCELVAKVLGPSSSGHNVNCAEGEWGKVKAKVLSNVGDRWLIQIDADQLPEGTNLPNRVFTIPREGVQIVKLESVKPAVRSHSSCKKL